MATIDELIAKLKILNSTGEMARVTLERLQAEFARNPSQAGAANISEEIRLIETLRQKYIDLAAQIKAAYQARNARTPIGGGATKGPAPDSLPKQGAPKSFQEYDNEIRTAGTKTISELLGVLRRADAQIGGANRGLSEGIIGASRALQKTGVSIKNISVLEKSSEGIAQVSILGRAGPGIGLARNYKRFIDDMGNWGRTLDEIGRIRFINDPRNRAVLEAARQAGFKPEDYRRSYEEGGGAYKVASFRQTRPGEPERIQNFRVNQEGQVSMAPVRRQFQSFSQSVVRDIVELSKWSIAISAIYGPINALSGAIQQLIENQVKLADVSIALDKSLASTDKVFKDVYNSAQAAGESVGGVIDAFGQAYRAAGRVTDESQRYQTSIKLLNDSLVLSKISTLDQAGAIDTLTAALYQSARSTDTEAQKLARGADLLDKWVVVSKAANVDVATLATGVAVLGDSAEAAGLSIDELNALIATIAETSIAGSKEAANIAKALIGNFQQESAVKELNRLGVAVIDVSGKTRQFLDVMRDVASMRKGGLITDQDFQRLTLALGGGGIRRQKDVTAFIENFGRMNQLVALQAGAGGESAEALAKSLDTVQTSLTRLGNALTGFVQGLGSQGGLLEVFQGAINLAAKLVEVLGFLSESLGKVGPLLLGLGIAAIALKATGTDWGGFLSGKVSPRVVGALSQPGLSARETAMRERGVTNFLTGQSTAGRIAGSALAIGLPAAQNLMQGDKAEAVGNVIGGTIGAVLGGPVGALAGSAIAEAFVRQTMTYDVEFANFFAGVIQPPETPGAVGAKPPTQAELTQQLYEAIGGGTREFGQLRGLIEQLRSRTERGGGVAQQVVGSYMTPEAAALAVLERVKPELAAYIRTVAKGAGISFGEEPKTPLTLAQEKIATPDTLRILQGYQQQRTEELRTQLITGEIKPSEFAKQMQYLSGYTTLATRTMAALGEEAGKLGPKFGESKGAYQDFLEIFSSGNEELINQINAQIAAVGYYQDLWENWKPGVKEIPIVNQMTQETTTGTKEDVGRFLKDTRDALINILQFGAQQTRLQNIQKNLPDVFGSQITPTPQKDINLIIAETLKAQKLKYAELKPEDYQALVDSFDKVAILVEDGGKILFKTFEGLDKSIMSEIQQRLEKEGKISSAAAGGPGFQQIDVSLSQLQQAVAQANAMALSLQKNYGYQPNFEDVIVATNDEQISKQHVDMKILQYILQQILDTEKKQLEGMYNIPEGATFWVPLTAAWLANRTGGGGGGGIEDLLKNPTINPEAQTPITPPTQAVSNKFEDMRVDRKQELLNRMESQYYYKPPNRGGIDYEELAKIRAGTAPTAPTGGGQELSLFQQMIQALSGLGPLLQLFSSIQTGRYDLSTGQQLNQDFTPTIRGENNPLSVNTKFDIRFASTTQLMVDGRMLASIIKPYLASEFTKTNETGGTITRTYVI